MINISLHIQKLPQAYVGGGGYSEVKYSKCQDLPKFQFFFWGGGILKSNTQSAKICLNFNLGGGGYSEVKYSKCQDLPKFQFSGRGGGVLENLVKNLLCVQKPACASQIVSHILRMWKLNK